MLSLASAATWLRHDLLLKKIWANWAPLHFLRSFQLDDLREKRWWMSAEADRAVENLILEMYEGLQSGETVSQSLARFAESAGENNLKKALRMAMEQHGKGISLVHALRSHIPASHKFGQLLIRAVEMQLQHGSDLGPVLVHMAEMIADEELSRAELQGKTVESRWTAWILAVSPVMFVLYFWAADPQLLEPLLRVSWGMWAIVYGLTSWVIGLLVLRWLLVRIRPDKHPLHELVVVMEFMVLAAKSGVNLSQCIESVSNPEGNRYEKLMASIAQEGKKGIPLRQSLANWENHEDIPEAKRLAHNLSTALSLGTPVTHLLERQSRLLRRSNRSRVEKQINALPLQLTLCTMFFLFPPVFVVVLIPSIINFLTASW